MTIMLWFFGQLLIAIFQERALEYLAKSSCFSSSSSFAIKSLIERMALLLLSRAASAVPKATLHPPSPSSTARKQLNRKTQQVE